MAFIKIENDEVVSYARIKPPVFEATNQPEDGWIECAEDDPRALRFIYKDDPERLAELGLLNDPEEPTQS